MLALSGFRAEIDVAVATGSAVLKELRELQDERGLLQQQQWKLEDEYGHREKAGLEVVDLQGLLAQIYEAMKDNQARIDDAKRRAEAAGIPAADCCYVY